MNFVIYKIDNNVAMRIAEENALDELLNTLEESDILVNRGEWTENEWPCDDTQKEAILKTFKKQLKGKNLSL